MNYALCVAPICVTCCILRADVDVLCQCCYQVMHAVDIRYAHNHDVILPCYSLYEHTWSDQSMIQVYEASLVHLHVLQLCQGCMAPCCVIASAMMTLNQSNILHEQVALWYQQRLYVYHHL